MTNLATPSYRAYRSDLEQPQEGPDLWWALSGMGFESLHYWCIDVYLCFLFLHWCTEERHNENFQFKNSIRASVSIWRVHLLMLFKNKSSYGSQFLLSYILQLFLCHVISWNCNSRLKYIIYVNHSYMV